MGRWREWKLPVLSSPAPRRVAEGPEPAQPSPEESSSYLAAAKLREEAASRRWEASGKNLNWWRSRPGTTPVPVLCTCRARRFPHAPHEEGAGPAPRTITLEEARRRLRAQGTLRDLAILDRLADIFGGEK